MDRRPLPGRAGPGAAPGEAGAGPGKLSRRQVLQGAAGLVGLATLGGLAAASVAPAPTAAAAVPQRYGRGYSGGYR